jgi:hypothetical protein
VVGAALSAGWVDFVVAPLAVYVVVSIVRSVTKTYDSWKRGRSTADADARSIAEFLFGKDLNPRTKTPAVKGWTAVVDEKLDALDEGQLETHHLIKEVISNQEQEQEHT